jgi:hypothetical protein
MGHGKGLGGGRLNPDGSLKVAPFFWLDTNNHDYTNEDHDEGRKDGRNEEIKK